MAKANDQTGLASGSGLMQAHREIALEVYGLAGPTPPRVAPRGPCGEFPAVNERSVALTLTWSRWSLEGLIFAGRVELATHLKKKL